MTVWDQATDTPTIKLADFGPASNEFRHDTKCGTVDYMAPEIRRAKLKANGKLLLPYTNAVDIWAMGKILKILVSKSRPNLTKPPIKQDKGPAMKLYGEMMSLDPTRRPTAAQCLQSSWLRLEESFSNPVAKKRKASSVLTSYRAKGPGPGTTPAVE